MEPGLYRLGLAARLLGVSVDTVRRWADEGRLPTTRTTGGHRLVASRALAAFAVELAEAPDVPGAAPLSARNRLTGIVTRVVRDGVAAQVEIQAGPHRIVSLMTREAADELQLEPGVIAVAAVKATSVVVERPRG